MKDGATAAMASRWGMAKHLAVVLISLWQSLKLLKTYRYCDSPVDYSL